MANRVLVPLDGSPLSESVVALGYALAETTGRREAEGVVACGSSLGRAFLSSVAEEALRQAPTTVLLARPR